MGFSPGEESRDDGVAAQAIDGAAGPRPDLAITRQVCACRTALWEKMLANMVSAKTADDSGRAKNSGGQKGRSCREEDRRDSPPPFDWAFWADHHWLLRQGS